VREDIDILAAPLQQPGIVVADDRAEDLSSVIFANVRRYSSV
jgi:hypothetical protein